MSLSVYQRELARMVSDPDHRRRIAGDPDGALAGLRLDARERKRLAAFSRDPGMRVNTVLYRANRLAPIYNALPRTCAAMGEVLGETLRAFWSSSELEDLQFPNEVARFVAFLDRDAARRDAIRGLGALVAVEVAIFELMLLPRRRLRAAHARARRPPPVHPLVRAVAVDVEPVALIEVVEAGRPLASCPAGAGGVLVDHRDEPGLLAALSADELGRFDPAGSRPGPTPSAIPRRR